MKITVDFALCESHGDCVVAAPDVFDLGEEDEVVRLLEEDPDESRRTAVEHAARMCPVAAIQIED
ncbi:Ferredoxin [Pseudonocardia sp. Ae168_Ps1]|uniref:ferredoxin n=1 Tax=unclassified Pseudonocardia TaxID=2619320 RepID=UPI00094B3E95|nr:MULTISPECIES: ferredoxin [unclassified Pseudonocardia]OLL73461.1 Ferredoxin [Pseudonocardia sp. Ae150A_Ps1]OLL79437.1 Ferredoxin [Pseudonocardia sp. Ae168_Ps1]OLL86428.1 Ferredoxin [Pseudonocardia sp. Ae263_Ps1]OLL93531.1 Ferredoxin [Pseudonocardia sp. Ae356_Ps1]